MSASPLSVWFHNQLNAISAELNGLPKEMAGTPWRDGGWTRAQIVGHLIDSAANNRVRFVRAAIEGGYAGPHYEQDAWVSIHGYADQPWETLLRWWRTEQEILMAVVDRIPEETLAVRCVLGEDAAATLRDLIQDYVRHQQWHLDQITARTE